MSYLEGYIQRTTDGLVRLLPKMGRDEIEKFVKKKVKQHLIDPVVNLDNNVTKSNSDSSLTELLDWIDNRKPVISGNATFYKQPVEMLSPTSNMLRALKKLRKSIKKEMFSFTPDSDEYQMLDLDQGNTKVIMNAEYGGSGAPTAAFYTKYSPPATTMMAQSIITTMANLFESVIGDNNKFMSIQECFDWIYAVLDQDYVEADLPKWICIPKKDDLKRRIKIHFYQYNIQHGEIIDAFIESLDDNETTYLYYAHNLHEFIERHENVRDLFIKIMSKLPVTALSDTVPENVLDKFKDIDSYNAYLEREMFMNPYYKPKSIEKNLDELIDIIHQFVYVPYITPDSIEKLNHHKRKTVLLVDTDSNVLYLNPFVEFIKNDVCNGNSFGRKDIYNDLIIVNLAASFLDKMITSELDLYGRVHNMDEDSRAELVMKNEFLFRVLMLLNAKKAYLASIVLREGNLFDPFKTEIKGVQFIKAAVSEIVSKRFTKIVEDNILFSEEINLQGLMRDVKQFESEIIKDMKAGGTQYLKASALKSESGYKDPWSIQIYKAANAWNIIYPEKKIYPLDRSYIVKLGVKGLTDIECIKDKFPEEYEKIKNNIFNSHNENVRKYGISVIAIPITEPFVPEWIRVLMDIELLTSNILASFRMIMDAFRAEYITVNTPSQKVERFSNFIKF